MYVLSGCEVLVICVLGRCYVCECLLYVLWFEVMVCFVWYCEWGDCIVVVLVLFDVYLVLWCCVYGLELICSELELCEGVFIGCYCGGDCVGVVKVVCVCEYLWLEDYVCVYVYGDMVEDCELFVLVYCLVYCW